MYRVYLSTKVNAKKLKKGSGIIVIETDDYTKTEIKAIKAKGYKVLGYISVGTIEKERPWYKNYKKHALAPLKDWPNERYADIRKREWRDFLINRARTLKKKGCDGWWCDNIDVYEYYKSEEMLVYCILLFKSIKSIGGYVMINGGNEFIKDWHGFDFFIDGYTQEEVFSRIISYKSPGKFANQKVSEKNNYKTVLAYAKDKKVDTFLLEYTRDESLKKTIKSFYKTGNCTDYYISEDVDL